MSNPEELCGKEIKGYTIAKPIGNKIIFSF
jgi:hypothetical protein